MDEEQVTQSAENTSVAEESNAPTSPVDEQNTSDESKETESQSSSAEESDGETQESSERKPSRAERRIRDLSQKVKQYEEQSNQPFSQFQQPPQPMFEDGREYTAKELEQTMVQAANSIASLQTKAQIDQYKAEVNLDRDAEVLPTKYPELNDETDDFVPELVESIEEEFKAKAFRNGVLDPSVRLADVAARQVKAARAAAKKSTAAMKNAVASQADTAAVKPGAGVRQEKSIDDMSSAELEAHLKKQGRFIKA